jgi:hypothetical protein
LTTTQWIIWKEQHVTKYQKNKTISKLKIINLIKSEISLIFSLAESKTGMTNIFCIYLFQYELIYLRHGIVNDL